MTTPAPQAGPGPAPREQHHGNVLTERLGPLATWVWLLIATAAILIYVVWRNRQAAAQQNTQATAGQAVGAQSVPDIIIQNQEGPDQDNSPAGSTPPSQPTPPPPPPTPGGTGTAKPPAKPPTKPPSTKPPVKAKPGQQYTTVTVGRWTATPGKNNLAPWNSTLWGIATHYHVNGGYQALAKLNGIKDPSKLTPGQKIKVPIS